ncbi:D-alanyl-D-alanine carboxypeptidase [Candidatus Roizmanbacteria bacterium]|nr:D-alanyl-D-alanine carboxypeptidase [Candidatus Roizmanbacteria bacterium]
MRPKYYALFVFFSLLFLFYPGDSPTFQLFAFHRKNFQKEPSLPLVTSFVPVLRVTSTPVVSAEGVYITDLASFTPIFAKNEHLHLYPASTTKIITALVVMDSFKLDDVITVKQVKNEGQTMGLVPGERITVENLLYGLLVHSGNDAAYAFADFYGYDAFISLMNKKAEALHMKDSHFANPAGLDDDSQVVTPFDLSLAGRELLKNPELKKIVSTKAITISDVDFQIFHKLENVNKLLGEVQGIGGLKTGYTEAAGENLVSFYKKHGHEFLIVILKSTDRFADTRSVVSWVDGNVEYVDMKPLLQ